MFFPFFSFAFPFEAFDETGLDCLLVIPNRESLIFEEQSESEPD
jgi:hypothetical protein